MDDLGIPHPLSTFSPEMSPCPGAYVAPKYPGGRIRALGTAPENLPAGFSLLGLLSLKRSRDWRGEITFIVATAHLGEATGESWQPQLAPILLSTAALLCPGCALSKPCSIWGKGIPDFPAPSGLPVSPKRGKVLYH